MKAQTLADAARQAAEAMQPAITLPGDLKLLAGGSIGTEQHPLSVGVSGTVDAEAPDGVYLAGFGDLAVARIETGADVVVNATGGLSGGNIHAEKAELNALGGSVGSREMPVALNVKELSGTARDEFHAVNAGDIAIGSVHAGGAAGIASSGSIGGKRRCTFQYHSRGTVDFSAGLGRHGNSIAADQCRKPYHQRQRYLHQADCGCDHPYD